MSERCARPGCGRRRDYGTHLTLNHPDYHAFVTPSGAERCCRIGCGESHEHPVHAVGPPVGHIFMRAVPVSPPVSAGAVADEAKEVAAMWANDFDKPCTHREVLLSSRAFAAGRLAGAKDLAAKLKLGIDSAVGNHAYECDCAGCAAWTLITGALETK